ncbi:50S ribosomal protein L11 methyltransferase [Alicyclobacillus sp. SO9]|uniref:50S ribosomal protein L11 methyltransferase n=1 Tax=Alicyclobacillus sp. SO9 TaxID=2665646 RepID=UPI0018E79151|nr:50S ribosomal protein L11 methyltransferase [Alicyclobacillus sp. SO9]QQE77344.1 50S ribosomal protein L11 methyltransferase [Alicyclobacillus sp. SO9]
MQWWEVSVKCLPQDAETVAALLMEWPEVQGVFYDGYISGGPLHPEYGEWFSEELQNQDAAETRVKVYLPNWVTEVQIEQRLTNMVASAETAEAEISALSWTYMLVDESAWQSVWQQDFSAIPVGQQLIVVPKWDRDKPVPAERRPIYLEPGRAFGTGVHATTQLCMELLEEIVEPQKKVLDVGCGTGVLSIAALRLGATDVMAVDVDPVAVHVTTQNAADNGVAEELKVQQSDLLKELQPDTYDVVVANILRDIVVSLTPAVARQLAPGGQFVMSGFLERDVPVVQAALGAVHLELTKVLERDGWVAGLAVKPV